MDKDRVIGSAKEVTGSVKETVGKAIGDAKLQADGKADKVDGAVHNTLDLLRRSHPGQNYSMNSIVRKRQNSLSQQVY